MPMLEAVLALALTMLSLAMIATLLVETVHRVLSMRAKDFEKMLRQFYKSELRPFIRVRLGLPEEGDLNDAQQQRVDAEAQEFIDEMKGNPLVQSKGILRIISWIQPFDIKPFENQTTENFFRLLAKTKIGQEIKAGAEEEIDEFVDRFSHAYEAFGDAANHMFKRRARLVSFISGIVVAFSLNTNAITIFEKYLDDPEVRAVAIAQAKTISDKFEKQLVDQENAKNKGTGKKDAGNEDAGQEKDAKELAEQLNRSKESLQNFKDEIESLDDLGIKFGYDNNVAPATYWKKSSGSTQQNEYLKWWYSFCWFVGVLVTGFLIGLGGPFWFNVVRKLTDVLQVARGGGSTPDQRDATGDRAADPMKPNKDAFKKSGEPFENAIAKAKVVKKTKAASEADMKVKALAIAMKETKEAASNAQEISPTLKEMTESMQEAKRAQKQAYEEIKVANQEYVSARERNRRFNPQADQ